MFFTTILLTLHPIESIRLREFMFCFLFFINSCVVILNYIEKIYILHCVIFYFYK